ncbi:unnamed protein product [Notodromas monacha]|uniref:Ig-like domain-containing protein n=1 Tax=Notodromas monacha TaxID=399045 RepID=A0A7R9BM32_9CRUS|nr:unnamed protein product [Notodromas monacha]CAG0916902.1 unnamed protein product [Notodromas monacha]
MDDFLIPCVVNVREKLVKHYGDCYPYRCSSLALEAKQQQVCAPMKLGSPGCIPVGAAGVGGNPGLKLGIMHEKIVSSDSSDHKRATKNATVNAILGDKRCLTWKAAENLTAIKPELAGLHPENTTVSVGEVAALQCVIVADGPPHVECSLQKKRHTWLKQMEPQELAEYDKLRKKNSLKQGQQQPEVIGDRKTTDFNGKPHWILNVGSRSSQGVESGNRTHYVSKLVIARASIGDTGTYVCLAANSMGYNYREARLIVRDHSHGKRLFMTASIRLDLQNFHPAKLRNSPPVLMDVPGESMQSPFSIPLIVILLVGPIVCLVMIGIFWKCSRKTATSGASVDPRSVTCSGLASDLGTAFTGKHDLNSVRTSDSSLGTPAHLRTPSKCWQAYYPVPTSSIQRAPSHMQRLYYNNQQQSLCDEAYEELDFVRRSPAGVVDDFAWDGSHNRTATTPSTFDGYDQLPVPGFHAFGPGRTGFRIIQNPNAFVK